MYFSNEALTDFLTYALNAPSLTSDAVEKMRRRLGLIPVKDNHNLIREFTKKQRDDGTWEVSFNLQRLRPSASPKRL